MKRIVIGSLTCAVAALAIAIAASAQSAASDSVTGTASECLESFEIMPGQIICLRRLSLSVDVWSGPAGQNPTGTVVVDEQGTTPGGSRHTETSATCLSLSGPIAVIGVTGMHRRFGAGFWCRSQA